MVSGSLQLCAGLKLGMEDRLHSVHAKLEELGGMYFLDGEVNLCNSKVGGQVELVTEQTSPLADVEVKDMSITQPPEVGEQINAALDDGGNRYSLLTQPPAMVDLSLAGTLIALQEIVDVA